MQLFELDAKYRALLNMADELDPTLFHDTLDSIVDAIEDKAINYAKIITQFKADVRTLKEQEKRFAERRQAVEKKIEILQNDLFVGMESVGIDKIKDSRFTVWLQNNPLSVKVTNESLIPKTFYVAQAPKLDKKALKEELQHRDIPGAV